MSWKDPLGSTTPSIHPDTNVVVLQWHCSGIAVALQLGAQGWDLRNRPINESNPAQTEVLRRWSMNSSRVAGLSWREPITALVTMRGSCFRTPRMTVHM